jgi:hypothetical protein
MEHEDDNVILKSKILVEIHAKHTLINTSYPRVEDNYDDQFGKIKKLPLSSSRG